jgi:hypothetical protein
MGLLSFLKAMEAKMESQIGSLASVMNAIEHERKAHHEEMMAKMDAWRGVTPACLEEEEPAAEETEVVAKSQEVLEGATDEEAIGVTEDRSRNLRLAVGNNSIICSILINLSIYIYKIECLSGWCLSGSRSNRNLFCRSHPNLAEPSRAHGNFVFLPI